MTRTLAPAFTVHRVTPQDAARMRALRIEMLADSPLAFLETVAQAAARSHEDYRRRIAQASSGRTLAQFVADPGGRLIGHAGGTVLPDDPSVTVVFAVYVTPAHRGGPVLPELIEAVAGWSRAMGRPGLMLEVVVGNDRAVRAYERLGFHDTGVRVPHPTVPALTELQMRRAA
jgi:RimJ/RimL family protein N-acetyltransferase